MRKRKSALMLLALLFAAGCSINSGQNTEADALEATWYGYLNPGQEPTSGDLEHFYYSYGRYPILTAEQSRHMNVR